jgi:hypothetical protein
MELHLGVVEQVITTMLRGGEVITTMRSEVVRMCIPWIKNIGWPINLMFFSHQNEMSLQSLLVRHMRICKIVKTR